MKTFISILFAAAFAALAHADQVFNWLSDDPQSAFAGSLTFADGPNDSWSEDYVHHSTVLSWWVTAPDVRGIRADYGDVHTVWYVTQGALDTDILSLNLICVLNGSIDIHLYVTQGSIVYDLNGYWVDDYIHESIDDTGHWVSDGMGSDARMTNVQSVPDGGSSIWLVAMGLCVVAALAPLAQHAPIRHG